jgi:hypothetical protein
LKKISFREKIIGGSSLLTDGVDNVVDFHETADGFGGQGDGGGGDKEGLDNILFQNVGDHALANVNACIYLALSMPAIKLES